MFGDNKRMEKTFWQIAAFSLTALIFAFILPVGAFQMVAVTECKQPEACTSICERQSKTAMDPKFTYDACVYVNCQEDGYFLGAWQDYQWCLQEQQSQAERLKRDEELQRRLEEAQNQKTEDKQVTDNSEQTKILIFGLDVKEGDSLKTGRNEYMTIIFNDGSKIGIQPNSNLTFVQPDTYQALKGKFTFFFERLLEGRRSVRVRTPTAVTSVRGTEFFMHVTKRKTVVQVLDGVVRVSNPKRKKSVDVQAGYQVTSTKKSISQPKLF